jgi:uncharacterized protein with PQ loop repeat
MADCAPPDHHSSKLVLGALLTAGMLISYIPQQWKIIKLKSSEGLSPWTLFASGLASTCTVLNVVILSLHTMTCCKQFSAGQCAENIMGVVQVSVQWVALYLIILLFVVYFPSAEKRVFGVPDSLSATQRRIIGTDATFSIPDSSPNTPNRSSDETLPFLATHRRGGVLSKPYKTTLTILFLLIAFLLTALALTLFFCLSKRFGINHPTTRTYASVLGLASMGLSTIQFLPQIWQTYSSKQVGALSIPTMLMQCPGSFLFAFSLWMQPGTNVTSYLSYLCGGTCQGILLFLAIYYSRNKQEKVEVIAESLAEDAVEPISPLVAQSAPPRRVRNASAQKNLEWRNSFVPSSALDQGGIVRV